MKEHNSLRNHTSILQTQNIRWLAALIACFALIFTCAALSMGYQFEIQLGDDLQLTLSPGNHP